MQIGGIWSASPIKEKCFNLKVKVMSRDSFKVLRFVGKSAAVVLAIAALIYNPGHLFSASLIWFGADELCNIVNEDE